MSIDPFFNQSPKAATFGPEDVQISMADGKAVPSKSLDALIAQARAQAGGGSKHTLRIAVRFNGEEYDFELPAPREE